jgi:hypothetical protein
MHGYLAREYPEILTGIKCRDLNPEFQTGGVRFQPDFPEKRIIPDIRISPRAIMEGIARFRPPGDSARTGGVSAAPARPVRG